MIRSPGCTFLFLACLAHTPAKAQRDTIPLNEGWQFTLDRQDVGHRQQWYKRGLPGSRPVQLPHTWNIDEAQQDHYGRAWYRRVLQAPREWADRSVVLEFGAVNHTAQVYVNGKFALEHVGDGFSKFAVVLDGMLRTGPNTITVAVDNAYGRNKVPWGNSFDWPNDGGLIRKVRLITAGKPAAAYVRTAPVLHLADSSATLGLELGFRQPVPAGMQLAIRVAQENQPTRGTVVDTTLRPVWREGCAQAEIALARVAPWHFDRPNLYRVDVAVLLDGQVVDAVSTCTGFRTLAFAGGLLCLNGEPVKLMGVEWTAGSNPGFGFAETDAVIAQHVGLMKDVNAIFTRQHFQQDDLFYELCDRQGILVQQELPLWGPETPANDTVRSIALRQLAAMVRNYADHPSIFAWGMGNELRARDADMKALVEDLIAEARRLDPSRFVSYVSNTLTTRFRGQPGFVPDAAAAGDFLMMNEYGGSWWQLPSGSIGPYLDSVHASYPELPFFISEFGLCEPNFDGGDPRRIQDLVYHMAVYESKPYIAGAIYFDLTDYRTHYPGTHDAPKYRRRIHGVYDAYGRPKPSMEVLRELSSPVEVQQAWRDAGGAVQVVLLGSTGLPQHTLRGYRLYVSEGTGLHNAQAVDLPVMVPGQRLGLAVPVGGTGPFHITVVRPTGQVATQKRFE